MLHKEHGLAQEGASSDGAAAMGDPGKQVACRLSLSRDGRLKCVRRLSAAVRCRARVVAARATSTSASRPTSSSRGPRRDALHFGRAESRWRRAPGRSCGYLRRCAIVFIECVLGSVSRLAAAPSYWDSVAVTSGGLILHISSRKSTKFHSKTRILFESSAACCARAVSCGNNHFWG